MLRSRGPYLWLVFICSTICAACVLPAEAAAADKTKPPPPPPRPPSSHQQRKRKLFLSLGIGEVSVLWLVRTLKFLPVVDLPKTQPGNEAL